MAKRIPRSAKFRGRLSLSALLPWAFAILLSTLQGAPADAALGDRDADDFRILASELMVDLDRFSMERGVDSLAIAIWPDAVGKVPLPPRLANEINDRLLSALLTEGGHRHRLVARDALRAVSEELAESSDLTRNLDPVLSALAAQAKADVLVISKLRDLGDGRLLLSYRAVNIEDGSVIAATSHREIEMSAAEMTAMAAAMTLEQALQEATQALADAVDDMEVLHLQGIEFEDTGQETPFGRYVEGRLADGLSERSENALTGRTIQLRYDGPIKSLSGTAEKGLHDVPGAYRLSGHYWDFGEVIELRLSLQNHEGPTAVWRQRIQASSLPKALRRQPLGLLVSAPPPQESVVAKQIAKRPANAAAHVVLQVQRSLQQLGYRPGPLDGVAGARTRAAIQSYQRDHGLPLDPDITMDLADHLYDSGLRLANHRSDPPPRSGQAAVPAGFIPPPGYCRVWFDHWSPNLQPPLATCDQFVGPVPDGARLVRGSEVWPSSRPEPEALFVVLAEHGSISGLTPRDRAKASSAYAQAASAPLGSAIVWSNPRSGNGGRITPLREGVSSLGKHCRAFSQDVTIAGRQQQAYGIACQEVDGSWQLAGK